MTAEWLEVIRADLELASGAVVVVVDGARMTHLRPLAQLSLTLDPAPWVAHRADQVFDAPEGALVLMILEPADEDSARVLNHSRPLLAERGYRLVLVLLGPDGWTWPKLREQATDLAHWHSNRVVAPATHPYAPALITELRELGRWKLGIGWHGTQDQASEALTAAGYATAPLPLAGPYADLLARVRAVDPDAALVADQPWGREGLDPSARTIIWLRLERARLARQFGGHRGPLVVPGPWRGAGLLPFDGRMASHWNAWHDGSSDLRLLGLLSDVDPRLVRWAEERTRRLPPPGARRLDPRRTLLGGGFSISGLNRALLSGPPLEAANQYFREAYEGGRSRATAWVRADDTAPFATSWRLPGREDLEQFLDNAGGSAALELRLTDESEFNRAQGARTGAGPHGRSLPTAEEMAGGGPARRPAFGAFVAGSTDDDVRFASGLIGDLGVMRAFGVEPHELPLVARHDPRFHRGNLRSRDIVAGTALDEILRILVGDGAGARELAHDLDCPPLEAWAALAQGRKSAQHGAPAEETLARLSFEWVERLGLEPTAGWARAELAWLDSGRSREDGPPRFADEFWMDPSFFQQLDDAWRRWMARSEVG